MRTRRTRRKKTEDTRPLDTRPRQLSLPDQLLQRLSEGQVEQIHEAALYILEHIGVRFNHEEALNYFRRAGAKVEDGRVYLDWPLLQPLLATTPDHYTLHGRHPAANLTIGGSHCATMPGGGAPYVRDLNGHRRPGTLADLANFARLSHQSPLVHVVARKAVEAQDVPPEIRHLICWYALLTLTDMPIQSGFVNGRAEAEDVIQLLAAAYGGEAAIDGTPVMHCSVNANSPLLYDRPMLESLLCFARYGQPILIAPFVMAGITGPSTLAGMLAQQNAEALAGIALVQLVRPGTPVLYGTASSNVDLRNANPAIGSPESAVAISACAQLARRYNLPSRGGGALTDSPTPDAQSNYERMFTLLTSALSGVHYLMHALGILESYLTMSYEQFVIDLELLAMIEHFLRPIEVSAETLALEAIAAAVNSGHFLETTHTLRHYRDAHFLPQLSLRQPYEQWLDTGGRDATQRANAHCRALLDTYQPPSLDPTTTHQLTDTLHHLLKSYSPIDPAPFLRELSIDN